MASEPWGRVAAIFDQAAELPVAERPAFLDRECGGDPELRRQVEALLRADGEAGAFLAVPALAEDEPGGESAAAVNRPRSLRRTIGPYKLLRMIGEGGMATVYLAVRADDEYRQEVAIKVFGLGRERSDLLRRFRTERQILASLEHPSIARLLDGGTTDDGLPYIVMERIEGEPIDVYCDRERLPVAARLELFRTLCSAVHYAHQNLVVHRDLKPSNVLVTAGGVPKLLDFGIAKLVNPEGFPQTVQHTATGQRLMTPQFASPEQVLGAAITTASDVYSMGVLLYLLLTGRHPYRVGNQQTPEIERAVLEQEPERPSAAVSRVAVAPEDPTATAEAVCRARASRPERLRRRLEGDLDNIVLKALRKEPRRRYGSIEQLDQDLRRYQQGLPVLARPDTLRYRAGKFFRRHRFGVASAAAFTLLVLGFAMTMGIQASRLARQRDQARAVAVFLEEIFEVSDPSEARGETITAREILERGAERIEAELEDQPEVLATLSLTIGNVYRNLGMYQRAEPFLRRSLDVRLGLLGEDHPDVADSLSSLGRLLRDRGDLADAEPLLRRVLDLRRRSHGDVHPAVAQGLTDLGVLLREAGDYGPAEALLGEALELRRQLPGEDPARLAEALTELGELYAHVDKVPAAETLFAEALEIAQVLFGDVHPKVADYMSNLAVMRAIQGKYDDAEPLLREALEARIKLYGEDHLLVSEGLSNLGRLRQEQGELEEAQELLERALAVFRRVVGDEHPRVVGMLNNLGRFLRDRGDFAGAEPYFREGLEIGRRILGDDSPFVAGSLNGLGTLLMAQGEAEAAEPLLREGLATLLRAHADDHRLVAESRGYLGECLAALGQLEEAESLVLTGWRHLDEKFGPEHPRTHLALDRVVAVYEAWGRPEDAAVYRAKKNISSE